MPRFQYAPGRSFFHRMDPTWKFAWNLAVVAAVLANFEVGYSLAWLAYAALLAPLEKTLRKLRIEWNPVGQTGLSAAGFAAVAALSNLEELYVWGDQVRLEDACLQLIAKLPKLRVFAVGCGERAKKQFTEAGITEFRTKRPDVALAVGVGDNWK